ncbi:MAG: excinuclease ABC subunit UvrC [Nitrospirae bacterium]|nr:excinuclease ABC subunit UvrC [Nitrospirota bacterium]NTW66968.1 excinuclease ABC subunit UvrC [Nitrospirota bacterium]
MTLSEKLQNLPDEPGVYLMKDSRGHIVYVGKAVSLKNRVRSYFQKSAKDEKTEALVRTIADLETIVTHTELEALILESTLIKKHHPRFNIILRDDKNYPYLRLDLKAEYPRLDVVRGLKKDGAVYYGPYVPAGGMWEILSLIRRTFPLATCRKEFNREKPERPCVQHQIGRCMAPCAGDVDPEVYKDVVSQVRLFIEGKNRDLIDMLQQRMEQASERMEFERAAELRDRIARIEGAFEKQKIISPGFENQDVIGIASEGRHADIQVLFVRNGMLLGRKDFHFVDLHGLAGEELLTHFLHQFYAKEMIVPAEVLLPFDVPDRQIVESWLTAKRGAKMEVSVPQRGRKREMVQMASDNAAQSLKEQMLSRKSKERVLLRLQEELGLRNLPRRIEAFDISNIQGTETVASMVSFDNNLPDKRNYKRFKIRSVEGQDDFASMAEVVRRRYARAKEEGSLPDLILIDGGKGQLNAALDALIELEVKGPDVIGLAKARSGEDGSTREYERVFLPGVEEPIILEPTSSTTHLVARVRDEAHRFAIEYHRKLREKRAVRSELDDIPGIGDARKRALLRHFGSLAKIKEATAEELTSVKGMTKKAAEEIVSFYRGVGIQGQGPDRLS